MTEANVLIVEDNARSAIELEQIVQQAGYKYWVVTNPREAINMIKARSFAVILSELRMPYCNGLEITKIAGEISPATSVVVMTAPTFISFAVEAMELGAYGYVTKPFIASEIKIVLERASERYFMMLKEDTQKYLQDLSVKDPLTKLYNRRFLSMQMQNEITMLKEEVDKNFSVVMIDVDDFKQYNDTKGHLEGDTLLKELAKLFQDTVRGADKVFRYGGEEFCLLLHDASKKEGAMISERIRTLVNIYAPTSISLGISTFPEDGTTEKELLSKADAALYSAKRTGKNKVVLA